MQHERIECNTYQLESALDDVEDVAYDDSSYHFDGCAAWLAAYRQTDSMQRLYRRTYSSAVVEPDLVIVLVFLIKFEAQKMTILAFDRAYCLSLSLQDTLHHICVEKRAKTTTITNLLVE